MFMMRYTKNGKETTVNAHYAKDILAVIEQEGLTDNQIHSVTGPQHNQEIELDKLRQVAEGRIAIPGQVITTPWFMAVRIARTSMSENEARDAGFTDESGCTSKYFNVLGKLVPNSRPVFAAALR